MGLWGKVKVLCNDGSCPRSNVCQRYINAGSANDLHIWFPRPAAYHCRNFEPTVDFYRGRKGRGERRS